MKEYFCKKDFYIQDVKFASKGDIVTLLPDNTTIVNTNGGQKVTNIPSIAELNEYFSLVIKAVDKKTFDNVNNPEHYASGGIECIDAMIAAYGKEAVMHFCQCNAFKYQFRFVKKNGIEDLKKAEWYNNKFIELSSK